MVKVTNGIDTLDIPNESAFKTYYKDMGFRMVEEEKVDTIPIEDIEDGSADVEQSAPVESPSVVEQHVAPEYVGDDILLKPVGEMNKEDLLKAAKFLGVDLAGVKVKDARPMIKEAIEKREGNG